MAVNKVIFGGNTLIDLSNDTVSDASHIMSGYVGHLRDGTQVTGTGSGGGSETYWTRPAEWPDLDSIELGYDEIYLSYSARMGDCSYACFNFRTSGNVTVDTGYIANGAFVVETTETKSGNTNYIQDFTNSIHDYVVLRLKGKVTQFTTHNVQLFQNDKFYVSYSQSLLEAYASMPYATSIGIRNNVNIQHIYLANATATTTLANACIDNKRLALFETNGFSGNRLTSIASMFQSCSNLLYADVKNFVTSACTKLGGTFYGCITLKKVDVSNWDTQNVTDFSNVFYYCQDLAEADVSGWDTGSGTTFSGTFQACEELRVIDVSDWDTSACKNFTNTFNGCRKVDVLDVSDWDVSIVTTVTGMFQNCNFVKVLDVSNWDTGACTNFKNFMNGCSNLLSLDISGLDMSGVTAVGGAQDIVRNGQFREVTIPASLAFIGSTAFSFDQAQNYHLLATTPPTLQNGNAFSLRSGKKIYVPYSADHSVLNAYKTASVWSGIATYIFEEPE